MITLGNQLAILRVSDSPNIMEQITDYPATKSLLVTIVAVKATSSLIAGKRNPASTHPKLTPRSNNSHTTKETVFLGINANSSSMTNHNNSSLDDWIVDGGCIGHMTYDKSILCDIKPHNSQIPIGDAST